MKSSSVMIHKSKKSYWFLFSSSTYFIKRISCNKLKKLQYFQPLFESDSDLASKFKKLVNI